MKNLIVVGEICSVLLFAALLYIFAFSQASAMLITSSNGIAMVTRLIFSFLIRVKPH
jgi:hypothetical protein